VPGGGGVVVNLLKSGTVKFSLVKGLRVEAFPNGVGTCKLCSGQTIAKCGNQIIHHWAHKTLKHCDNWWENETDWHRSWKSNFPKDWQEVIHFDDVTGEKHIADIRTPKGIVIEFQNSPMSAVEMQSREKFYKNLVWVVNGQFFKESFTILDELPDPRSKDFADIIIHPISLKNKGKIYHKVSEDDGRGFVELYNLNQIKNLIISNYTGHHHFDWRRPRQVWFSASTTVLFDFGDDYLWKLILYYPDRKMYCVKKISKAIFIEKANS
jgi:competence protein CoiA